MRFIFPAITGAMRMTGLFAVTALAWLAVAPIASHAQAPGGSGPLPSFEVASIKRNNSGANMVMMAGGGVQPGGRVDLINLPLRQIILRAYGIQSNQLIGGPGWIDSDRFDIVAKAEDSATTDQINLMLRSLLVERFQFAAHAETRELPIYALVLARDDGRLGPDLNLSTIDCSAPGGGRAGTATAAPPEGAIRGRVGAGGQPGGGGQAGIVGRAGGVRIGGAGLSGGCRMLMGRGLMQTAGQPLSALANALSMQLGRPVVDRTGLTGNYDVRLQWRQDGPLGGGGFGAPFGGGSQLPAADPDAPSLFTALEEQLGLKLESTRGPVDVLVIDRVEPPTED